MYESEPSRDDSSLVALQVPDQMPPDPQLLTPSSQLRLLLHCFLNAILPDVGEAGVRRCTNRVGPEAFGYRNDRHRLRDQARKLGPHLRQTLREGLETHSRSI